MPKAGDGDVDEARVDLLEVVVSQPVLGEPPDLGGTRGWAGER